MELQTQDIANVLLIQVEGRVDLTTASSFQDLLLPRLTDCTGETKKVLLDLSGIHYMSSAGLRVLVLAARQCKQQQGEMVLAALPPFLQDVFRIAHFDVLFKMFATVSMALEHLSPTAAAVYNATE